MIFFPLQKLRQSLAEAEHKIVELHEQLVLRENENRSYDRQIAELSKQVAVLEREVEHCQEEKTTMKADLDATKELCDRLDVQKDKLNEELSELSEIRRKVIEMEFSKYLK